MRNSINISSLFVNYNSLVRKLKYRHPSYFDEYKSYQKDIFPNVSRTEDEMRGDYYLMAFKIEIRKNPKYSFLSYEVINEIAEKVVKKC